MGTLNINSIRYKFEQLKLQISDYLDILVIVESKLDSTFPTSQFIIDGFKEPIRLDRTGDGGGILIYIKEGIPFKELDKHTLPYDIEAKFIELNFRKNKLLFLATYNPSKKSEKYFLDKISNSLDQYIGKYDRFLLTGDFNLEVKEHKMSDFLHQYNLKCLVKEPTCFKSVNNPSCIDLFLTNCPKSFQNTASLENDLSDFHNMVVTVYKTEYQKPKPKTVTYRDYKRFDNFAFRNELEKSILLCNDYDTFHNNYMQILDKHAPYKTKLIRSNHAPYMTKRLRKAIMHRSQLLTKYRKSKSNFDLLNYKKHKNFVSRLYKKEKTIFTKN